MQRPRGRKGLNCLMNRKVARVAAVGDKLFVEVSRGHAIPKRKETRANT